MGWPFVLYLLLFHYIWAIYIRSAHCFLACHCLHRKACSCFFLSSSVRHTEKQRAVICKVKNAFPCVKQKNKKSLKNREQQQAVQNSCQAVKCTGKPSVLFLHFNWQCKRCVGLTTGAAGNASVMVLPGHGIRMQVVHPQTEV